MAENLENSLDVNVVPPVLKGDLGGLESGIGKSSPVLGFLSNLDPYVIEALGVAGQAINFRQELSFIHNSNKVFVIDNSMDYLRAFHLRSQVYGEELGYSDEFLSAHNAFEFDNYDKSSIHLMSLNKENEVVGVSRLILDKGEGLPTGEKIDLSSVGNENSRAEISRMILRKDYRANSRVLLNHLRSLVNIASQIGTTDIVFSVIDEHVKGYHPRFGGTEILEASQVYGDMPKPVTSLYWNLNGANQKLFPRGDY